jgi:anti-sigma factor RsiW
MECRDVRQLSDSYLSEELQTETNEAILSHLERCPACRAELDGRRALRATLRSAFERSADLQPRPEFIAALREISTRPAAPAQPLTRRRAFRWLASAAAFVLVTLGGFQLFEARVSADPLRRAVAGDHRFCALGLTTGGEKATEISSLEAAASRDEPAFRAFENAPPEEITTGAGVARVLNRHSCMFDGRRFAHLVLRYHGTAVSIVATRGTSPAWLTAIAGHSTRTSVLNDLTMVSFRAKGYSVFVVGSLPAEKLAPLADAISAEVIAAVANI